MKKLNTLLAGFAMFAMTANAQYVTPALDPNTAEPTFDMTQATDFVPFYVCPSVLEAMDGKILIDQTVDDVTKFLYVWADTYVAGNGGGINSFGIPEDHLALTVTSVGWSGFGFCIADGNPTDMSVIDNSTSYLHFAIKGDPSTSHQLAIAGSKFALGDVPFVDNGQTIKNLGTWKNDGEWYNVDIPMSALDLLGTLWNDDGKTTNAYTGNTFWGLSGGVQGTELHLDNIFIYRKTSGGSGIANVNGETTTGETAIYTLDGVQVKDMSKAGIYVVKSAEGTKKVMVK